MKLRHIISLTGIIMLQQGSPSTAHWLEHEHLPRWAQRGAMRSCVCPFDAERLRPWIDTDPLACEFTVAFTGHSGWEDAVTPTEKLLDLYVRPRRAHLFVYTCPNSIYWDDEFERVEWRQDLTFERYRMNNFGRYPYAKDCVNIDRDGRPTVAYPWPSRRHRTSYFATPWIEHHKQIMTYMVKGKGALTNRLLREHTQPLDYPGLMDGFYFDNAGRRQDWGPLAMQHWEPISRKHFGKVVDPKTSQDPLVRALWQEMQDRSYIEYHNAYRKHGWTFDPPRLTLLGCHGPYGYYAAEVGFPDIEFYENTYRVQPQGDNIWDIKCGLARTHGKAQACLNHERFRPAKLSGDRSFEVLNWALTREFARLSMAECMAMGGNHMVQIGPLVYVHLRFGAEYVLYNGFNRMLEDEIYLNAVPAARLAVLWPIMSEANGTADTEPLGHRLWTLGIPYDVVIEHDLTATAWPQMDIDLLILPDTRCLNEPRAQVVLDWVRRGGRLIVSQSLAERDERGLRQNSAGARELLGDVGGRMRYSAIMDFVLDGYEPEKGGRIWLPALQHFTEKTPEGTAALKFIGVSGTYDLLLDYLDEDDGCSTMTFYRNDEEVWRFDLDQPGNKRRTKTLAGLALAQGDTIRIHAKQHAEEFCRIYGIELVPSAAEMTQVTFRDVGKGRVAFAPEALTDYSEEQFVSLLESVSDGQVDRCVRQPAEDELGGVFCNLMRDAQHRGLQVHLVNAAYRTPERYAPMRHTNMVCRADVPLAEIPAEPVVRLLCWGTGTGWDLAVRVNDLDLAPVPSSRIPRQLWLDIPVAAAALKVGASNRVEVRLTGKPNTYNAHAALYIDTREPGSAGALSQDGGKTFDADDLSTLNGIQQGAYVLSITNAKPAAPRQAEMTVKLAPQQDVSVVLHKRLVPDGTQALLISPDMPSQWLDLERQRDVVKLRVPSLQVYDVVVLSKDQGYLAAIETKVKGAAYQPTPPRTPEFSALLRAGAAGRKLTWGSIEGDWRLRGVDSIEPAQVAARNDSRSFGKDLKPGEHFVVQPDGSLHINPLCPTNGGRIFLTWTEMDGGHYRDPYFPYVRLTEKVLLPPGWRAVSAPRLQIERAAKPGNVHEGQASVRIAANPGAGISTVSEPTDPGRPYRLSVWLKVVKGEAQVNVYNGATLEPLSCPAGDWTCVSADFVAEGQRVDFKITAAPGHDESVFYADDASLVEQPE